MNSYQHERETNRVTGIKLVLPDERPARRARLTAAEVLDLFQPGLASAVETPPVDARSPRASEY